MSTITPLADAARSELTGVAGELIWPGGEGYDVARRVYNAMIDRRPALITRCTSPADVAAVIRFGRAHDRLIAIRSGGHNGAGLGVCDDGVVIDLAPMRHITIDQGSKTVRVGGGCTLAEIDRATHEFGMAVPFGINGTTGVSGLTLGGGIGYLARKHGLTIDSLLEAEVVLADGSTVRAGPEQHPDLFWAIRGGGGNFGVVTSFLFRMHPVGTVIAGPTFWSIDDSAAILRAYREFLPAAPRELNGFFAFGTVPPAPAFPEKLHGRKVAGVFWCHTGSAEEAAAAIAPMLEAAEPLLHAVGPMPFPVWQSLFDGLYPTGLQWYWRADFVRDLPDAAIEKHIHFGREMPPGLSMMHLYPIDGAVHP